MKITQKATEYYQGLPSWGKGVVVVVGAFVVYTVGKKLYRFVFPSAQTQRNQQIAKNIDEEIKNWRKTQTQSFTDSQYGLFANQVYDGMAYCVGDDYDSVEETLKRMNNNLDVALLIKAYGFRQRYCFGIPAEGIMDLFTSVQAELGEEWGFTNYRVDNINNAWARKGITYRI
jgi:hypothetical protein